MDFKSIQIEDYEYALHDEQIAKYPLSRRDNSKLLVYKNKCSSTSSFSKIGEYLKGNETLVFNNTKVVRARLLFKKHTGASIEIFILNPVEPASYESAFSSQDRCTWNCIVGNLKKWKGEQLNLSIPSLSVNLYATMIQRSADGVWVQFSWQSGSPISFSNIIEMAGEVPIPPYLNRKPEEEDSSTYQTIYAKNNGSVAAPTAGLHFTPETIEQITNKGCILSEVTLHVGAGTFKPVKTDTIGEHQMHIENILVSKKELQQILKGIGSIVAVGTTSMRTLESLYWLGVKLLNEAVDKDQLVINQWDGYNQFPSYSTDESFRGLLNFMEQEQLDFLSANTQMIIVPGYEFKVVNTLITNFHQPRSTLLLLVAAFVGNNWKQIYQYALENNYRFLSYGDSSILFG